MWRSISWHDPRYGRIEEYTGWLLQVDTRTDYPKCTVVDDKGRMRIEQMDFVQVHVPPSIPLLHGAPRRGDSDEIAPATGPYIVGASAPD